MNENLHFFFCRHILRMSKKKAEREARRRGLLDDLELTRSRRESQRRQKPGELSGKHAASGLQVEGDGDITVYPEVQ